MRALRSMLLSTLRFVASVSGFAFVGVALIVVALSSLESEETVPEVAIVEEIEDQRPSIEQPAFVWYLVSSEERKHWFQREADRWLTDSALLQSFTFTVVSDEEALAHTLRLIDDLSDVRVSNGMPPVALVDLR